MERHEGICLFVEYHEKTEVSRKLLFVIFAGLSSPVDKEDKDDDGDYLQDKSETDYEEGDFDEDEQVEKSSKSPQPDEQYKTQEYTEKSDAGKTVTLKCKGEGFEDNTLFMWYNGSAIVVQGDIVRSQEFPRLSFSKKDGSLTIKDVNSYDDATFRCRAFPKKDRYETLVHLHINGPPRGIRIGHNINSQKNVAGQTLMYRAGEKDLRFKCNVAKARPEAKIDWIHNGNTILESQGRDQDIKIEDEGLLIIKTLHARHAGDYQCEASNELGTLKASFKIEAQCKLSSVESSRRI